MEKPASPALPDDERLYALVQEGAWLDALRWLHAAWKRLDGDARARRAAVVFDEAFFTDLDARSPEALRQRLLLHHGRMRTLPDAECARLTDALTRRASESGDAEAVRSLARLSGEEGTGEATPGLRREVVSGAETGVQLTRVAGPGGQPDARASLFKSGQEQVFFEALRAAFPTHLVYPNAALNAVLDYERLGGRLSQVEQRYFFRALVDAVVVDSMEGMRPVYFFELDSAHHDAAGRRRNDGLKDRILAKAGQTLFRLRRTEAEAGRAAFAQAIRAAVERV